MSLIDTSIELMKILNESGCESYLVGGSVRDYLLGRDIKDIDIATSCKPDEIEYFANQFDFKYIPTGIKHGTSTILYKDIPVEITTFRTDVRCHGRHADVEFICNLQEDLARRDFTINSMAMDSDKVIIDLFGGQEDLKNKLIKTVGDPYVRFEEDKLRIMRAVRFSTVLEFDIDTEVINAIRSTNLEGVSNERIRDEFSKILIDKNRLNGLLLMDVSGLLEQFIPEIVSLKNVTASEDSHPEKDTFIHTMLAVGSLRNDSSLRLVLAVLFHDIGKPHVRSVDGERIHFYDHEVIGSEITEEVLNRLKYPRELIDEVVWIVKNHMRIHFFDSMKKSKKITLINEPLFDDLFETLKADITGSSLVKGEDKDFTIVKYIEDFVREHKDESLRSLELIKKKKIITGYDVMNMGVIAGKDVGFILDKVYDEILEGNILNREDALEYARGLI